MNTHPDNRLFRAIKAMAEPEFTAKLTYAEQNAMHAADPQKYWRYTDWLFGLNAGMSNRWARRERQETTNLDIDRTHDQMAGGYDDYTSNPKQSAS